MIMMLRRWRNKSTQHGPESNLQRRSSQIVLLQNLKSCSTTLDTWWVHKSCYGLAEEHRGNSPKPEKMMNWYIISTLATNSFEPSPIQLNPAALACGPPLLVESFWHHYMLALVAQRIHTPAPPTDDDEEERLKLPTTFLLSTLFNYVTV